MAFNGWSNIHNGPIIIASDVTDLVDGGFYLVDTFNP